MAGWYFDAGAVLRPVAAATARILPLAAERTLSIARRLMAFRRGPSPPGTPPSAHTGILRRFLVWTWDGPDRVQAGPETLRSRLGYSVPEVLEYGGSVIRSEGGQMLRQRFRARPYMRPAGDEVAREFPEMWRDSVRP